VASKPVMALLMLTANDTRILGPFTVSPCGFANTPIRSQMSVRRSALPLLLCSHCSAAAHASRYGTAYTALLRFTTSRDAVELAVEPRSAFRVLTYGGAVIMRAASTQLLGAWL
jgi:hypothetical protein